MLGPVRRRFEVGLWGSATLSKGLFFPAIEGDRVIPGNSAREAGGEGAQEAAGEGAREAAGEGAQEAAGEGAQEAAGEGTLEMGGEGDLDPAGDRGGMLVSVLDSRMGLCSRFVVEFVLLIPEKSRESKFAPLASTSLATRPPKPSSVGNVLARHSSGAVFVY